MLADEGRLEVLTDGSGVPTGTTEVQSLNAGVGGTDTVNVGSGYNVVVGGAAADSITVNGTTTGARGIVLGDNGQMVLSNSGLLLSIESSDFASGAADTISLTAGTNAVIGGAGGDQITAGAGSNTIVSDDGRATFFTNGDLRLIESINLGVGGDDTISLQDGTNSVIAGAGEDLITIGDGTNFVLGDEGRLEVLTDGSGIATGTTQIQSLNASIGGDDTINVGPGSNVIVGGAASDTITVNGTTPTSRATVLGDSGSMLLANAGNLLSIESNNFASGAADTISLTTGINTVIGGAGDDQITAGAGSNTVLGDDGQATFFTNGDLKLIESINLGGGGNDTITLQNGTNSVIAGAGNDTVSMGLGTNFVLGDEGRREVLTDGSGVPTGTTVVQSLNGLVGGTDTITVGSGYNVVAGGANVDTITVNGTTAGARGIVLGDNGKMTLTNSGTLLEVESTDFAGGAGDTINLTAGTNAIIGGAGNDQITATTGRNTVLGDDGHATFYSNGDLEFIESINPGNGGDDTISLQAGINAVIGGAGSDTISATTGTNTILGDEGEANLHADGNVDLIQTTNSGVGGTDTITLGDGANIVIAGADADTVSVGAGTATILGDEGQSFVTRTTGVITQRIVETLNDSIGGNDVITATGAFSIVMGGAGSENIAGVQPISGAAPKFFALGDSGRAEFNGASQLLFITTKSPNTGAADTITLASADDIVFGGDAGDTIDAKGGNNIVIGDHGSATFDPSGQHRVVTSIDTTSGGNDTILVSTGNDIIIGGFGSETITSTGGRDIIIGDSGRAEFDAAGVLLDAFSISNADGNVDTINTGLDNDIIIGGTAGDSISDAGGDNIILGDSGHATWDATAILRDVRTTDNAVGGADTISTGTGNDLIIGGSAGDSITSTGGNNIVLGDNGQVLFDSLGRLVSTVTQDLVNFGDDTVNLGHGDDIVLGGSGKDLINGGNGNNVVLGDNGTATFNTSRQLLDFQTTDPAEGDNDTINVGTGDDVVIGGAANDSITAVGGRNILIGDNARILFDSVGRLSDVTTTDPTVSGNDSMISGTGNDVIFGGSAADSVADAGGRNIVVGDNGHATFDTSRQLRTIESIDTNFGGIDTISTGAGDDVVLGGNAGDTIAAANGSNIVLGDHGTAVLNADGILTSISTIAPSVGGNDTITSGTGNDVVFGGFADDRITITAGNNVILGDNGAATFDATGGLVTLTTSDVSFGGLDVIAAGGGRDVAFGGSANDILSVGHGANLVLGDNGNATFNGLGQWLTVDSSDPAVGGNDRIFTGRDDDTIVGGVGGDTINGMDGRNVILGDNGSATFNAAGQILTVTTTSSANGGVDAITAGIGDDVVFGGSANDTITASNGKNVVTGDNARATFDPSGQIRTIETIDPAVGGNDTISTGLNDDVILGGAASDAITTTGGNNFILGDNGIAAWNATGVLQSISATNPTIGGNDTITSGVGSDLIVAGTGGDTVTAGAGNDLIFGDHGSVTGNIVLTQLPLNTLTPGFTFTSIATLNSDLGGNDLIRAGANDDIVIGGQGFDRILGEAGDDDIIGGHSIANGHDSGDWIDGGSGHDYIAGDNALIRREPRTSDTRWRTLTGTTLLGVNGNGVVSATAQTDPSGTAKRAVTLYNHTSTTAATMFGSDRIAGGSDNDTIFGQLGNDAIQGDGAVVNTAGAMIFDIAATKLSADDYDGIGRDGDDYVEGGGGSDTIFGNLGQDDLIGGSSNLFGTPAVANRPDAGDIIYGGSGTRAARNDAGDTSTNGHARDADVILGDNGNIFRIVGIDSVPNALGYLQFTYDIYGTQKIVPRSIQYLEYVFGGTNNTSLNDEIHGEAGDDIIHGMSGHDVLFGDAQDDDLIGGQGNDRISGGDGEDGILGDDGRIFTSRNGQRETLHGILTATNPAEILLAGTVIGAVTNVSDRLKKSVDLASYTVGGHDIVYGGLGDDFIHGGAGDDALSGAEATTAWYITTPQGDSSILDYNATTRMFAAYNAIDPLSKITNFVLNFDATDSLGAKSIDGMDNIFGNDGNDWLVGGTMNDRMFGGMGDDLLNADDNLETNGTLNNMVDTQDFADADFAFGGGGFDVLIANTGADRLIDWSKRFNTFVVPVLPTVAAPMVAAPTVLRDPTAPLIDLLIQLGRSGGADQSISVEADALYAELGLVTVEDGAIWNAQIWQGLDRDPRPANLVQGIDTLGKAEARPAAPTRVTATTAALTPTFNWLAIPGAARYEIRIDRVDIWQVGVLQSSTVTGTSYTAATPLVLNATYRVWIRAINVRGEVQIWSAPLTIKIVAVEQPSSSDGALQASMTVDAELIDEPLDIELDSILHSSATAIFVSSSTKDDGGQTSAESRSPYALDAPSFIHQAENILHANNTTLSLMTSEGSQPTSDMGRNEIDSLIESIANELLLASE